MISEKEQFSNACGCGSAGAGYVGFDGDNETEEGTSNYLGFAGTDDEDEFDGFLGLGKKAKEKRAIKKDLIAQGYSRKDARQQAKEKVGGGGIMDAIEKVKGRVQEFRNKAGIAGGASAGAGAIGGENTSAGSTNSGDNTSGSLDTSTRTSSDSGSEGFNWRPYAIWGGVGIAVLAIGFIAYKKFAKK
jgi:hypothetical protein